MRRGTSLLLAVCTFLYLVSPCTSCSSDQYYGVKSMFGQTCYYIAGILQWECKSCPADAVQHCAVEPKPVPCRDEYCVCKKGFYAVDKRQQCLDYTHNPDGGVPLAEELFRCVPCPPGQFCPGGSRKYEFGTIHYHVPPQWCPHQHQIADATHDGCVCPVNTTLFVMSRSASNPPVEYMSCGCHPGYYWDRVCFSPRV